MTYLNPGILNKDNVRVRNNGVKGVTMTLSKIAPILQTMHLNLRAIPRSLGLNIHWLNIVLSQFNQTCMLLMDYPYIKRKDLTDYA